MIICAWFRIAVLSLLLIALPSASELVPSAKPATAEFLLSQTRAPVLGYEILRKFPHNTNSFTQGLVTANGHLYEGTGRYGQSALIRTDLLNGNALKTRGLSPRFFGEGITVLGDEIFQLTYKSNTGFVYNANTFEVLRTFTYSGQGWGLATDGSRLIMSDGSPLIRFLDPQSFEVIDRIIVSDGDVDIAMINELEYIDGRIFANIWLTDLIAVISPDSGVVEAWIDLRGLNPDPAKLKFPYVLNGIAHEPESGALLVTGKCWPELYAIRAIKEPRSFSSSVDR